MLGAIHISALAAALATVDVALRELEGRYDHPWESLCHAERSSKAVKRIFVESRRIGVGLGPRASFHVDAGLRRIFSKSWNWFHRWPIISRLEDADNTIGCGGVVVDAFNTLVTLNCNVLEELGVHLIECRDKLSQAVQSCSRNLNQYGACEVGWGAGCD